MNQVGRYQIQEELARDATGIVYRADDPAIGRTVAVKSLPLGSLTDGAERRQAQERLLGEIQDASLLSHPNIVAIYDFLEQEDFAYIFMEYVHGSSLEQMSIEGKLPTGEALLRLLRQVAEAVDYAHNKGIVHRDLKPANILISQTSPGSESLAKVANFGIAKFVSYEMAQSGTIVESPNYMSPEQIQDTPVDGRSDQFSFAAITYELLTGTKPFSSNQLPALFYAICKQDPPPANQLNPALSEAAGKVLGRALMKEPSERFASCSEFIGALSIAISEAPVEDLTGAASAPAELAKLLAVSVQHSRNGPVISIPEPVAQAASAEQPYEVPTRVRRHREQDERQTVPRGGSSSGAQKLVLILAMFFAIGAVIIFIVMSNSGPTVPVQVLDTRAGPVTPPPEGMEVKNNAAKFPNPPVLRAQNRRHQEAGASETRSPAAASASPAVTPGSSSDWTDVELLTEPPGAKMILDDRPNLTCTAPCTLNLAKGRHTVSAELAGFNVGKRIFTVPADDSVFVNLSKSMGVLVVTSNQSGCSVLVDGHQSGYTPATLHLTAGSHRIAVVSRATRHEETVQVQTDGFDVERFICQ